MQEVIKGLALNVNYFHLKNKFSLSFILYSFHISIFSLFVGNCLLFGFHFSLLNISLYVAILFF